MSQNNHIEFDDLHYSHHPYPPPQTETSELLTVEKTNVLTQLCKYCYGYQGFWGTSWHIFFIIALIISTPAFIAGIYGKIVPLTIVCLFLYISMILYTIGFVVYSYCFYQEY